MTLDLNLNSEQQKEIKNLLLEKAKKREAEVAFKTTKEKGQETTAEERFKIKNQVLDEQIALKEQIKKTLTTEQFNKWESKKEYNTKKMSQKRNLRNDKRKANQEVTK